MTPPAFQPQGVHLDLSTPFSLLDLCPSSLSLRCHLNWPLALHFSRRLWEPSPSHGPHKWQPLPLPGPPHFEFLLRRAARVITSFHHLSPLIKTLHYFLIWNYFKPDLLSRCYVLNVSLTVHVLDTWSLRLCCWVVALYGRCLGCGTTAHHRWIRLLLQERVCLCLLSLSLLVCHRVTQ